MGEEALVILAVSSSLVAIKCLLIPAYVSTDFEVHRNWMAITHNKNLLEWYTEKTSEWTLDYPPFFAYFERILAYVANILGLQEILKISSTPVFNQQILIFQRVSVILTDLFYITSCALYSFNSIELVKKIPLKMRRRSRIVCFTLLATLQLLLIIDSIHFQYNSMLTAIFVLSIYFIERQQYCVAAMIYSILVNFKHIYIYYALGYVIFYLYRFFDWKSICNNLPKAIALAASLAIPFVASFGPFWWSGGNEAIVKILERLFPVSRGLTHAYWAPNFWAIYNFLDLILYRILKILKIGRSTPPTYTTGLVQEYEHSVLWNISTLGTLIIVLSISLIVLLSLIISFSKNRKSDEPDFVLFAVFSSLTFFFFGYHVHEKAILLVTVPMTIYAIKNLKFVPHLILISTVGSFTIFPLLFTNFEICLKYSIAASYLLIQLVLIKWSTRIPLLTMIPIRHIFYFLILLLVEIYNSFIHKALFDDRYEFAPLLAISIVNSIGVLSFFVYLIWSTSFDGLLQSTWHMAKCRVREELIKEATYSVQTIDDEADVDLVAGIDVSASKSNSDLVVMSMSVFRYSDRQHLATFCDTEILEMPYIPQYLAVRESEVVANFIRRIIDRYPEYRPDVLLCDGFGQFHSRGCGMACHIGALTGIASVGVAKNLPIGEIHKIAGVEHRQHVDKYIDELRSIYKLNRPKSGYIPFDIVKPCKLNVIRMGSAQSGVFVSAGYGIELELATRIAIRFMENATTCEPIREADLKSRELIRKYFD